MDSDTHFEPLLIAYRAIRDKEIDDPFQMEATRTRQSLAHTQDIDIWIDREPDNVQKLLHALGAFGFGAVALEEKDILTPDQVIRWDTRSTVSIS